MALREEFEKSGNWLFRHRSNLPFLMISIIVLPMPKCHYLGNNGNWIIYGRDFVFP